MSWHNRWQTVRRLGMGMLLCVLLVVPAAPTVAAQDSSFEENTLIQGPDGTLFVFEGGSLHQIAPTPATTQQLQATPRGDPVTTGIVIIPPEGPSNLCGEAY